MHISLCLNMKIENSIMRNSVFMNSGFIFSNSTDTLNISTFSMSNNFFFSSCFVTLTNFAVFVQENIFFLNNFLNKSLFLNVSNQIYLENNVELNKFSVFGNQFIDNSLFMKILLSNNCENFTMSNFIISNNSLQKIAIQIKINCRILIFEIKNISFIENEIFEGIIQISIDNDKTQNLLVETLTLVNNNLYSVDFLNFKQQFFIFSGQNLNLSLVSNFFWNNICSIGPCGFLFSSIGYYKVSIISSTFSNNLALYQSDDSVSCVILMFGTLNLTFSTSVMKNNSINEYDQKIGILQGYKGNPCIYSDTSESYLYIFGSYFFGNSGYQSSSCVYFSGNQIEVSNSSFEGSYSNVIMIFFLDVITTKLENLFFSNSYCGGFALNTQRENILISAKNIIIVNNSLTSSSFIYFYGLKYHMTFINITFISNECHGLQCFLYLLNAGIVVDEHQCNFSDSQFVNNKISNFGLFVLALIGSMTRIENCLIQNNTSTTQSSKGSVIFIYGENTAFCVFIRCKIVENSAFYGGIAYIKIAMLTIDNCILESNSVKYLKGILINSFLLIF